MIILLDMDCVLVHFVEGAARAWGLTFEQLQPHWPAGAYGMTGPLGRALRGNTPPMLNEEFWAKLDSTPQFWLNLEPLPWCVELTVLVRFYSGVTEWYFVSDPSDRDQAIVEKRRWLHQHIGPWATRKLIPTEHKHLLANPRTALIDDNLAVCNKFAGAGGQAILFPAWHNPLYEQRYDPVLYVENRLCTLASTI